MSSDLQPLPLKAEPRDLQIMVTRVKEEVEDSVAIIRAKEVVTVTCHDHLQRIKTWGSILKTLIVDLTLSCKMTLCLINHKQTLARVNFGEVSPDSICIKPDEFLNSYEIIKKPLCNWVISMDDKEKFVHVVIEKMNKFARQMSEDHSNRLLLHVDVKYVVDHLLLHGVSSAGHEILEQGMEDITVVPVSESSVKSIKRKRNCNHDEKEDCLMSRLTTNRG